MQHFRNRDDLVAWLEVQPLRKTINRALQEGTAEVVGGFYLIPPILLPGWIVRITSVYKRIWNVAIVPDPELKKYRIHIIENIPWRHWAGGDAQSSLYAGDHPEEYRRLKDAESR